MQYSVQSQPSLAFSWSPRDQGEHLSAQAHRNHLLGTVPEKLLEDFAPMTQVWQRGPQIPGGLRKMKVMCVFASRDMGSARASNLKNLKAEIHGPCLAQNHPVPLFPRGENSFLLASTTIFLDLEKLVL